MDIYISKKNEEHYYRVKKLVGIPDTIDDDELIFYFTNDINDSIVFEFDKNDFPSLNNGDIIYIYFGSICNEPLKGSRIPFLIDEATLIVKEGKYYSLTRKKPYSQSWM